jgi:hypothetical protein
MLVDEMFFIFDILEFALFSFLRTLEGSMIARWSSCYSGVRMGRLLMQIFFSNIIFFYSLSLQAVVILEKGIYYILASVSNDAYSYFLLQTLKHTHKMKRTSYSNYRPPKQHNFGTLACYFRL